MAPQQLGRQLSFKNFTSLSTVNSSSICIHNNFPSSGSLCAIAFVTFQLLYSFHVTLQNELFSSLLLKCCRNFAHTLTKYVNSTGLNFKCLFCTNRMKHTFEYKQNKNKFLLLLFTQCRGECFI